ncbi:voltage-dependent calcium channel subunit alpha-2/delta-3 isoform X2 [Tetranychus urticae]|uniref:voltage-dependent calcium channel subunit alpha-2/delta-3 isoform X2 n=1 Tax=Tetranychus urticae TaxID=32264 RepID=UPI00077B9345|nr:voltage-dependent calcium channel subunit alpha-2/delta-3 isoform X2 [Tetranychus urticae]
MISSSTKPTALSLPSCSRMQGRSTKRRSTSTYCTHQPFKDAKSMLFYVNNLGLILLITIIPLISSLSVSEDNVKYWALRFGKDIYEGSAEATCLRKIEENYAALKPQVENVDCPSMLQQMKEMVTNMFNWKKEMVEKIAKKAEKAAEMASEDNYNDFSYINSKRLYDVTEVNYKDASPDGRDYSLLLTPQSVFRNVPVYDKKSAVHIPTNVFEDKQDLKEAIKWSEKLDAQFDYNHVNDSEVNWQFFCSSKGFLRFFPASKWRVPQFLTEPDPEAEKLDLYDCRVREWYVKAAASPKDVVILLDGSGSMTGQRKEIAKAVVASILDTLTDDDFVTVIRFSDDLEPTVKCFGDRLIEANKQNLIQFKHSLIDLNTTDIADFKSALTKAFEILQAADKTNQGSQCNQAIMLVTDGAPDTFREIFEQYNYPRISIRVFTYLVGKEVTETKQVNLMACENRGYYTQVTSLSEIREQVQLYLPVMSRPLVLSGARVFRFTGVYADITDVPLTPWVWDEREREKIRKSLQVNRRARDVSSYESDAGYDSPGPTDESELSSLSPEDKNYEDYLEKHNFFNDTSVPLVGNQVNPDSGDNSVLPSSSSSSVDNLSSQESKARITREVKVDKESINSQQQQHQSSLLNDKLSSDSSDENGLNFRNNYNQRSTDKKGVHELMTTISLPVFDVKNTTNITERFLVKNVWRERVKEVRSANLLGVAGIDIPIREIVKRTPAYKLGVNGYSFAINNNGHILFHPDLRPLFQDLLKPFYSSVDLLEVELTVNHPEKGPREYNETLVAMREGMIASKTGWTSMEVKMHIDSMKRAITRKHKYCYEPIHGTPFSLGISLPKPYGEYRVIGGIEIKRRDENYTHFFRGNNWRVHPDWTYCDNDNLRGDVFDTPEGGILHMLKKAAENESNIWYLEPSKQPPVRMPRLTCEKDLVRGLVYDAKATDIDAKRCGTPNMSDKFENRITTMYGVTLTFVATRSGLTRFEDHRAPEEKNNNTEDPEKLFMETHNRAIDELYYQRAVDFHRFNSSAFVFSVPFDAGDKPGSTYVTGSRAIFLGKGKSIAPVAAVGLLFRHDKFAERFFNFSSLCKTEGCNVNCSTDAFDCFLVDNNGFVVVSKRSNETGKFYGEVDYPMFEIMVSQGIYKEIKMYDYQAICIEVIQRSGPGSTLITPLQLTIRLFTWLWARISYLAMEIVFGHISNLVAGDYYYHYDGPEDGEVSDDPSVYSGEEGAGRRIPPNKTRPYPCDKEFYIYEMQNAPSETSIKGKYSKCDACEEEYIIQPVPYTNLLILVVETSCHCTPRRVKINPMEIKYPDDCTFERRRVNQTRRRPNQSDCKNTHPEEGAIKQCGKGWKLKPSSQPFVTIMAITLFHLICIRHLLDTNHFTKLN